MKNPRQLFTDWLASPQGQACARDSDRCSLGLAFAAGAVAAMESAAELAPEPTVAPGAFADAGGPFGAEDRNPYQDN